MQPEEGEKIAKFQQTFVVLADQFDRAAGVQTLRNTEATRTMIRDIQILAESSFKDLSNRDDDRV